MKRKGEKESEGEEQHRKRERKGRWCTEREASKLKLNERQLEQVIDMPRVAFRGGALAPPR